MCTHSYLSFMKYSLFIPLLFLIFLVPSCSKNDVEDKLTSIQDTIEDNPQKALSMLDSIEEQVAGESEFLNIKYDLLRIIINEELQLSCSLQGDIMQYVATIEKEGSEIEKQKAYYCAGIVFRDMNDFSRSLLYFGQSLSIAENNEQSDSFLAGKTSSMLFDIYFNASDYSNALKMAKKEEQLSGDVKKRIVKAKSDLGKVYFAMDSLQKAKEAYDVLFSTIKNDTTHFENEWLTLLMFYSQTKEKVSAEKCYDVVSCFPASEANENKEFALANYYLSISNFAYAKTLCDSLLYRSPSLETKLKTSEMLFDIYRQEGNEKMMLLYSRQSITIRDSLERCDRQRNITMMNNITKYYFNEISARKLLFQKKNVQYIAVALFIAFLFIACVGYAVFTYIKNKSLQNELTLSQKLANVTKKEENLRDEIDRKDHQITLFQQNLTSASSELHSLKKDMRNMMTALSEFSDVLRAKELQLQKQTEQAKTFQNMLHQTKLESKASDVIAAIRNSSAGRCNFSSRDWKKLYKAVDEIYPDFRDVLVSRNGNFSELQIQVCYLMRIGLSNQNIQNITNLSRSTVWRWTNKFSWINDLDHLENEQK